ncbi:MAG: hypothetical protein FWH24_00470 [Oscillospiraceae bacterium]|nr:hypothetical protein [Oscillospiraceae bacterium]
MRIKISIVLLLIALMFPCINLNAAAAPGYAELQIEIDYINETIKLSGKSGSSAVKYMYSPLVSAAAEGAPKKQALEKWYPVYGDEINISKFIPKNDKNNGFVFAFRDADEIAGSDGLFKSRKTTTIIRGRPNVSSADFKNAIAYNPKTERIEIKESFGAYDYQVGLGSWIINNTSGFIPAASRYNPLGEVFVLRASAVPGSSFASNEFRLKIPRAPAAPKIRLNEKTGRLAGVQTNIQWSPSPNGQFVNFKDKTGSLSVFKDNINAFATEKDAAGNDCIAVYIRVAATDRLPTSPLQKLLIRKSLI